MSPARAGAAAGAAVWLHGRPGRGTASPRPPPGPPGSPCLWRVPARAAGPWSACSRRWNASCPPVRYLPPQPRRAGRRRERGRGAGRPRLPPAPASAAPPSPAAGTPRCVRPAQPELGLSRAVWYRARPSGVQHCHLNPSPSGSTGAFRLLPPFSRLGRAERSGDTCLSLISYPYPYPPGTRGPPPWHPSPVCLWLPASCSCALL